MCYGATCPTCSKQAWRGCGSHIPGVFANVPEDKWCTCEPKVDVGGRAYPPQAKMAMPGFLKGWIGGGGGSSSSKTTEKKEEL
ncbi:hypothetical protein B0H66DRAFT_553475 [Apodospora peruviana]|uniref:Uncharacterized protein n=1 Tax=Apodospora peruviana TaxID=516989 RepID=A0AAE0IBL2_9PEZI|nr:hypothetical protein B0H66DRAFT_553475 [Apodospora peruviana]